MVTGLRAQTIAASGLFEHIRHSFNFRINIVDKRCPKTETMKPIFFKNQSELREWLEENHQSATEVFVGIYKKGTPKENFSWSQLVDQVLCFGWIDGVSKKIDTESWQIRITPRKPSSIWSNVNINKVKKLTEEGLMQKSGLEAFAKRKENKSGVYAFESEKKELDEALEKEFRANEKAWNFFTSQAPSYQKTALHLVMTAKQETTKRKRFEELVADSEAGLRIKSQRR